MIQLRTLRLTKPRHCLISQHKAISIRTKMLMVLPSKRLSSIQIQMESHRIAKMMLKLKSKIYDRQCNLYISNTNYTVTSNRSQLYGQKRNCNSLFSYRLDLHSYMSAISVFFIPQITLELLLDSVASRTGEIWNVSPGNQALK